ncbi:MAG: hypothetical protein JWP33_2199, partial [Blastococcus sp.]|nr:hypothetical protein [Blastococcus sp.]
MRLRRATDQATDEAPDRPGSRGRVCLVRQRDYYELSLRREAEALRDAGFDVDIVCLREPGSP